MSQTTHPYPVGTKVQVAGFPTTAGNTVSFNFNGLVGEVRFYQRIGSTWDDQPAYQYLVHFDDVDVPYSHLNPETNKLEKGSKKGSAENFFEQDYLQRVV